IMIARREEEVLRSGVGGGSAEERRTRLAGAGIMRSLRRVDQMTMLERAAAFFAPAAACLPATSSPEALTSWMPGLVRSARRGTHPLLHVLMDAFLDAQPHVASRAVGPFGAGPWPCLNPLASHTGEAVVIDLTSYTTKGRVVARFSCRCGYVYSRGLSADGGQTQPRFYRYGALLEPELRRLVGEGVSLRAAGRALCLDPKTVVAEAKRLGLPVTWRIGGRVDARMSRTAIPPSTSRAAGAGPRRMPVFRQNWSTRDAETLGRCEHAAAVLMKLEPPSRLTYAAIERAALGRTGWIRLRSRSLPRTINFIEGAVESAAAYKRRRAVFEIGRSDGAIPPWRVMRAAGLTGVDLPVIRELMECTRPEILRVPAKPTVVLSKP
ncbi:TnsD family Tn7-like transposition protein, partial [Paracraurococcus lichenis]